MTLLYILMLWCAISFFCVGLWIVYLETARWLRPSLSSSRRLSTKAESRGARVHA